VFSMMTNVLDHVARGKSAQISEDDGFSSTAQADFSIQWLLNGGHCIFFLKSRHLSTTNSSFLGCVFLSSMARRYTIIP